MARTLYRVYLRRESEQTVEFGTDEIEDGDSVVRAAYELADPMCWWSDGDEVDRIQVSHDAGKTWTSLPIHDVLRLEKEARG